MATARNSRRPYGHGPPILTQIPTSRISTWIWTGQRGLGRHARTVTASADAAAVYACQNNGGNLANDPKKTQVSGPVSRPSGQHRVLVSVSSTNVQVSGGGDTASIPGTFSRTFVNI